jgi:hypothetical protein
MDSFADRADRQTSLLQSERSCSVREAVELAQAHPNSIVSLTSAATACKDCGQLGDALQYYLRALDLAIATGLSALPHAINAAQCLEFCGTIACWSMLTVL